MCELCSQFKAVGCTMLWNAAASWRVLDYSIRFRLAIERSSCRTCHHFWHASSWVFVRQWVTWSWGDTKNSKSWILSSTPVEKWRLHMVSTMPSLLKDIPSFVRYLTQALCLFPPLFAWNDHFYRLCVALENREAKRFLILCVNSWTPQSSQTGHCITHRREWINLVACSFSEMTGPLHVSPP